jgi:hypothetical protein
VHFEYAKNESDNVVNVTVFTDLTNGGICSNLVDQQFYYLSHFFENMKEVETKTESMLDSAMYNSVSSTMSDSSDDMGKSLYESALGIEIFKLKV